MSFWVYLSATLVALEFFYILYLETFATTSVATSRVFSMEKEELERPSVNTLFKNQGVYNGLIGLLILVALFLVPSIAWLRILMGYIIAVALYGGLTSDPKIIIKQGGLALLTLVLSYF